LLLFLFDSNTLDTTHYRKAHYSTLNPDELKILIDKRGISLSKGASKKARVQALTEYDKEKEDLNASNSFSHSTVSSRFSSMEASTEPTEEAGPTVLLGRINLMNDTEVRCYAKNYRLKNRKKSTLTRNAFRKHLSTLILKPAASRESAMEIDRLDEMNFSDLRKEIIRHGLTVKSRSAGPLRNALREHLSRLAGDATRNADASSVLGSNNHIDLVNGNSSDDDGK
jgi:hypothetical protein